MKLYVQYPFDSPIAPAMLSPEEFSSVMWDHGIAITTDPHHADVALIDAAVNPACRSPLPRRATVLISGEPPQPEYLLPCYLTSGYKAIVTPLNGAYADPYAFYRPPSAERPEYRWYGGTIVQLATYRTVPGPLRVVLNGRETYDVRVLCDKRAALGLALRERGLPIHIYGQGWPEGVAICCSRHGADFLEERDRISARHDFDLCWENVQLTNYVTEKFWSPLQAGTLPEYRGEWAPPIGCGKSVWLPGISKESHCKMIRESQDWYRSLPTDCAHTSWIKAAHHLARVVSE